MLIKTRTPLATPYLLIDFVEHCGVVVFFRVVVEADHAILLVNASVDLAIFNLCRSPKEKCKTEIKEWKNLHLIKQI